MRHFIFISLVCMGLVALGKSQQTFRLGNPSAIKKIKSGEQTTEKNQQESKFDSLKKQNPKRFDSLERRSYGEAQFTGIVMSHRRVQEAGGVTNCYITLRITQLEQNKYQPLVGLKAGDIVQHVLDTPLCELRTGSRTKGLLIDNNFFVADKRGLMLEVF